VRLEELARLREQALQERRRRQKRAAHLRWQKRHPELARAGKRRTWARHGEKYAATQRAKRERAAA
jgi:hypothetical protein